MVLLCVSILVFSFLLFRYLSPNNHVDNLHETLENKYNVLISQEVLLNEIIKVPQTFDSDPYWVDIENQLSQTSHSLEKYRNQKLERHTYYVLDSPYQRSLIASNERVHCHVYINNNKVVAAYLFHENNPQTAYALDHVTSRTYR